MRGSPFRRIFGYPDRQPFYMGDFHFCGHVLLPPFELYCPLSKPRVDLIGPVVRSEIETH